MGLARDDWPWLTADRAPLPGVYRARLEDFRVEELPRTAPSGSGDHVRFEIEKRGLSTAEAVRRVAGALGVRPADVGFAGHKDARAVTRQALSVEHVDPARVRALDVPGVRVLGADRHRTKLRAGELAGNRFRIVLRETAVERVADAGAALDELERRGLPNYFGPQRFGHRGDTARIGRALLERDFAAAARLIAGSPGERDSGAVRRARELFEEGRFDEAARTWPAGFAHSARVCRELARSAARSAAPRADARPEGRTELAPLPGAVPARRAVLALPRRALGFYVSGLQALLFNRVLARRLPTLDRLLEGDLPLDDGSGRVGRPFEPASRHAHRPAGRLSATGPLFGPRMRWPEGVPGALEREVLDASGLALDRLPARSCFGSVGGRRPLRVFPAECRAEVGRDDAGEHLVLAFTLPPGAFATALLRELGKGALREAEPPG